MQLQTEATRMSCPACGFQVFNRRYPKCERCAAALPASLVYSDLERKALLESEGQQLTRDLKNRKLSHPRQGSRGQQAFGATWVETSTPTSTGDRGELCAPDSFASGGGGTFDGGGGSGSFGGDGGGSSDAGS